MSEFSSNIREMVRAEHFCDVSNLMGGVPLNHNLYTVSLAVMALAVLINRGNGSRMHQAVQLYLMLLLLVCTLVAFRGT